jgi:hypothetical protein
MHLRFAAALCAALMILGSGTFLTAAGALTGLDNPSSARAARTDLGEAFREAWSRAEAERRALAGRAVARAPGQPCGSIEKVSRSTWR